MNTFYIILLIILGILFLVAEIVLLPGVSVGAILSAACFGTAIYLGFTQFGNTVGIVVIVAIIVTAFIATIISLRAKTWRRLKLDAQIESSSMESPEQSVRVGDRGITVSRLAPIGKALIDGKVHEAKSGGEYIDPKREVEVIGFENFAVIVKEITE